MKTLLSNLFRAIALFLLLAGVPVATTALAPIFQPIIDVAQERLAAAEVLAVIAEASLVSAAHAGTATINTDAPTDVRLQAWCQKFEGLASAPNAAQVKACIIKLITQSVIQSELAASVNAITPTPVSQMN